MVLAGARLPPPSVSEGTVLLGLVLLIGVLLGLAWGSCPRNPARSPARTDSDPSATSPRGSLPRLSLPKLRLAGALKPVAPRRSNVAVVEAWLRARHRTIFSAGARTRLQGVLTAAERTGTKKVAPHGLPHWNEPCEGTQEGQEKTRVGGPRSRKVFF